MSELRTASAFETHIVDYDDLAGITRAAEGCDAVVHLVGIIKESQTTRYEDAHEGTCQVLVQAAQRAGISRIVYLSIFGADPASANACLASKGRAERILQDGATPCVVIRLPMVIGPGDIAARALQGQARARLLPMVAGGRTLQQPLYAGDVVRAIETSIQPSQEKNVALDLGGPEVLSHRDLVRRAAALYGNQPRILPVPLALVRAFARAAERLSPNPPLSLAMLGVLQHDDRVDSGPACERLGLELTSLDETLRRCVGPEAESG